MLFSGIVFAYLAERVYVGVICVVIEVLVLDIEHLLCGGKFNGERAHPSHSVVCSAKAASFRHLGRIRRRSKICSKEVEWARSSISDRWRNDVAEGHASR
jgi:hypothetical protein